MIQFLILMLAVWLLLTMEFSVANAVLGLGAGLVAIVLSRRDVLSTLWTSQPKPGVVLRRTVKMPGLLLFFLWEVLLSNLRITRVILSPKLDLKPAIVAVDVQSLSRPALIVMANFITLTPGTLSLDISADQSTLYVHTIHLDSAEQFRTELYENVRRRVQEVFQ
jgi:multicomponent Na+:H+ antiporter subunit E